MIEGVSVGSSVEGENEGKELDITVGKLEGLLVEVVWLTVEGNVGISVDGKVGISVEGTAELAVVEEKMLGLSVGHDVDGKQLGHLVGGKMGLMVGEILGFTDGPCFGFFVDGTLELLGIFVDTGVGEMLGLAEGIKLVGFKVGE